MSHIETGERITRGGVGTVAPGATWVRHQRAWRIGAAALCACSLPASVLVAGGIASAATTSPQPVTSAPGSYIVEATAGHIAQAEQDAVSLGGRISVELPIVNGFSAWLPAGAVASLTRSHDVAQVTVDAATKVESASYNPASDVGSPAGVATDIGSPTYWQMGYSGNGVGVALIDSGVAPVPALAEPGKVFYGPDFTPTGYFSQVRGLDTYGHGTFMAGLIAGKDPGATAPYSAYSSYYLGVAPDAHIVSVKVADASGATMQSAVIAGIQWVVQHRNDPGLNIRVLNLSLGARDGLPYTQDPLDAAVEAAWKSGITVVAAAGNDGKIGMTAPANDPYVIAVAAVDPGTQQASWDDVAASFSDKGDGTRNPDFGVIGMHIAGPRVPGSAIDQRYGNSSAISAALMRGSGTSEAAALASGAVALLLSQRPNLTPDQAKATLVVHASWMQNLAFATAGAGELNMAWVFNAATEYRTQTWPMSTATNTSASWSVLNAPASRTPSGATWTGATWTGATWTGATWTGATWTGATWTGATWTGATWTGATWTGATWTGATWTGATWTGATWTGATWTGATWTAATWTTYSWH